MASIEHRCLGDGNCQFRALSFALFGNQDRHKEVRSRVVELLRSERDFYAGFVRVGEFPGIESYDAWVENMERTSHLNASAHGDNVTLQAAARVYGLRITVWRHDGHRVLSPERVINDEDSEALSVSILYNRTSSHYDAIEIAEDCATAFAGGGTTEAAFGFRAAGPRTGAAPEAPRARCSNGGGGGGGGPAEEDPDFMPPRKRVMRQAAPAAKTVKRRRVEETAPARERKRSKGAAGPSGGAGGSGAAEPSPRPAASPPPAPARERKPKQPLPRDRFRARFKGARPSGGAGGCGGGGQEGLKKVLQGEGGAATAGGDSSAAGAATAGGDSCAAGAAAKKCSSCGATHTPLWHTDKTNGQPHCNACFCTAAERARKVAARARNGTRRTAVDALEHLRGYIAELGGSLPGEGWRAEWRDVRNRNKGHWQFVSPGGKRFDSMPAVARGLNLLERLSHTEEEIEMMESEALERLRGYIASEGEGELKEGWKVRLIPRASWDARGREFRKEIVSPGKRKYSSMAAVLRSLGDHRAKKEQRLAECLERLRSRVEELGGEMQEGWAAEPASPTRKRIRVQDKYVSPHGIEYSTLIDVVRGLNLQRQAMPFPGQGEDRVRAEELALDEERRARLDDLRTRIRRLGGELGEGWVVQLRLRNEARQQSWTPAELDSVFVSPEGSKYQLVIEVARQLKLVQYGFPGEQAPDEAWLYLKREERLWQSFGMRLDDLVVLIRAQGHVCALDGCSEEISAFKGNTHHQGVRTRIDHIHVEGWDRIPPEERLRYVRGAVCDRCNRCLLPVAEDPEKLRAVEAYITEGVRKTQELLNRRGPPVDEELAALQSWGASLSDEEQDLRSRLGLNLKQFKNLRYFLWKTYGLTVAEHVQLYDLNNGFCHMPGCNERIYLTGPLRARACKDHFHHPEFDQLHPWDKRLHLRGYLCHSCNVGRMAQYDEARRRQMLDSISEYLQNGASTVQETLGLTAAGPNRRHDRDLTTISPPAPSAEPEEPEEPQEGGENGHRRLNI